MQPTDTREMLFADTAALGMPGLILLAVAIATFIVWLAVGTREPDVGDVLQWIVAGVLGVVVIAYAGSWHEVGIDPAAGRITVRYGYLGYALDWMGEQHGLRDFTTVLVERTTSDESVATSSPGSQGAKVAQKTVSRSSYTLSLRGAGRKVDLPMATLDDVFFHLRAKPQGPGATLPPMQGSDDVLALEAAARQLARLGGWTARRRGYALPGRRGEAADRPPDQRPQDEPSAPAWFSRLPFMPKEKTAAELRHNPVSIEIVAADAESPIDEK